MAWARGPSARTDQEAVVAAALGAPCAVAAPPIAGAVPGTAAGSTHGTASTTRNPGFRSESSKALPWSFATA
jgi:hypothetical protein